MEPEPKSELVLYQTEDGQTRLEVRLQEETVWLTQAQMADLFQTTKQNVSLHVRNAFNERELQRGCSVERRNMPLIIQKSGKVGRGWVFTTAQFRPFFRNPPLQINHLQMKKISGGVESAKSG